MEAVVALVVDVVGIVVVVVGVVVVVVVGAFAIVGVGDVVIVIVVFLLSVTWIESDISRAAAKSRSSNDSS